MEELSLNDIFAALRKHMGVIIVIPVIVALITAYLNFFVFYPAYTATTSMYVLNKQDTDAVSQSDLSSAAMLVADYQELLKSDNVLSSTEEETGISLRKDSAYDISVSSANNTRVIAIGVEGPDPETAATIANALAANLSDIIYDVMRVENISIVDEASAPETPSAPSKLRNTALAGAISLMLVLFIVLLIEMLDTRIKTDEDVNTILGLPVLAKLPSFEETRKA